MAQAEPTIRFASVTTADFALLGGWLAEPHVRRWWGDPDRELQLIREGLATSEVECFIASIEDAPLAYMQVWWPNAYDDEPWFATLPPDTPGIDVFIGPPEMIGRGFGAIIIRALAERLFNAGAPRIVIDPDAANIQAVRAYTKAGFVAYDEGFDGDSRTVLMEKRPDHR